MCSSIWTAGDGGTRPPKEVNTDLLLERLHRYPVDDQLVPLLRPYRRAPSTDQKDEPYEKDGAGGAPVSDPAPRPLDR